jgi:hypothetical protein
MARLDHPEAAERVRRRDRLILSFVFFCLIGSGWAAAPPATAATVNFLPQLVKAKVQALGLGAKVKIATVFRRKQYRGYITRIDDNSFEVADVKSLTPNVFQYSGVDQVNGRELAKPANHAGKRGVTPLLSMVSRVGFGP